MTLFAHITLPDTAVLASVFCLGIMTGIAATWITASWRTRSNKK